MARGWESKAVEAQQDEAGRAKAAAPPLTDAERRRRQEADGLRLALADATAQLQAACRPVHRDMLRQRITALETRLAAVESGGAAGGA